MLCPAPTPTLTPEERERRFEALLARHGESLKRWIANRCPRGRGIQSEDVEQVARLRIWRALERSGDVDLSRSYLFTVALDAVRDAFRQASARREDQLRFQEDDDGDDEQVIAPLVAPLEGSPDRVTEARIAFSLTREAVRSLPEATRRAIRLRLLGLTVPEIARELSFGEGKTRSLLYRGLADLKSRLDEPGRRPSEGIERSRDRAHPMHETTRASRRSPAEGGVLAG